MKKGILNFGVAAMLVFGALAMSSCGNATDKASETAVEETEVVTKEVAEVAAYACPMKCEGDKTYAEAGACPKCSMALALVETEAEVSHEGHNHDDHAGHNH